MTADEIVAMLGLKPLEKEGGYFVETYRSGQLIPEEALPDGYGRARPLATSIYYLLKPDAFSALHRLRSDEIYHFYLGDPVEMLLLYPDASSKVLTMGPNLLQNMSLQVIVPGGVWQGSRVVPGGSFALLGTTMAPGYDPADFELGRKEKLLQLCPSQRDLITALCR